MTSDATLSVNAHRRTDSQFLLLVAALGASVITALLTWDWDGQLAPADYIMRTWHLLTVAAQLTFAASVFALPKGQRTPLKRIELLLLVAVFAYVLAQTALRGGLPVYLSGIGWMAQVVFLAALLVWLPGRPDAPGRIWMALGLIALLHMLIFAVSLWVLRDVVDYPWLRRPPGFTSTRHLSFLMGPAAVVMAVVVMSGIGRRRVALALICFAAAIYYLMATGSRGALLGAAAGFGVAVAGLWASGLKANGQQASARTRHLVTGLLLLGCTSAALLPLTGLAEGRGFSTILERAAEEGASTDTSGRLEVWRETARLAMDNRLWGIGPKALHSLGLGEVFTRKNHPHNFVLQVLAMWGLVGAALLAVTGAVLARSLDRHDLFDPSGKLPALAVLVTMLVHGLVSGGLFYPFSVAIFLVAFAVLVQRRPEARHPGGV